MKNRVLHGRAAAETARREKARSRSAKFEDAIDA